MQNKRISLLHYRLDNGGIDRVACFLADGFAQAGYEVDLVVFCDNGSGEDVLLPLLSNKVNLCYLGSSRGARTKDLVRLFPACVQWIGKHKPSCLISTCNHMNWITIAAAKFARSNPKTILKTTNPIIRQQDHGFYAAIRKFGYSLAIRNAERTLALSEAETQMLRRQFPSLQDRFVTVTNPYVTKAMLVKPSIDRASSNRKTIIAIGRFEAQKRFDLLIKAFASLNRFDTDLIILGDGSQKYECEQLVARLKLQGRISMPGFVNDVSEWLHKADMLVMTSRYEGLPAVVLEALAANCPVLTTDCFPAAREIIGPLEGCDIIESTIPNDIAKMMAHALARPKSDTLHLAAQNYSIENGIYDHIAQIDALF